MTEFRVMKGAPSPEELAALAVALLGVRLPTTPAVRPMPCGWRDLARRSGLRGPLTTGSQGWRESRWSLGGRL
ncbi:acyl-CoA carboxylase epsilon subunit [Microbispora sp. NBC_01389]|uniref:acyl-CoA carboxylase epsilon subunit n=1 Tax=Microbispora sp. NBC_01389 TaxID=2903584 RepID=UPI00324C36FE